MQGYFNSIGCCKMNRHWQSSNKGISPVIPIYYNYNYIPYYTMDSYDYYTLSEVYDSIKIKDFNFGISNVDTYRYNPFQFRGPKTRTMFSNSQIIERMMSYNSDYYSIPYRIYGKFLFCLDGLSKTTPNYTKKIYIDKLREIEKTTKNFKGSTINNIELQTDEYYKNYKISSLTPLLLDNETENILEQTTFINDNLTLRLFSFDISKQKIAVYIDTRFYAYDPDNPLRTLLYTAKINSDNTDIDFYYKEGSLFLKQPFDEYGSPITDRITLNPLLIKNEDNTIPIEVFEFMETGMIYFNGYISFFENVI